MEILYWGWQVYHHFYYRLMNLTLIVKFKENPSDVSQLLNKAKLCTNYYNLGWLKYRGWGLEVLLSTLPPSPSPPCKCGGGEQGGSLWHQEPPQGHFKVLEVRRAWTDLMARGVLQTMGGICTLMGSPGSVPPPRQLFVQPPYNEKGPRESWPFCGTFLHCTCTTETPFWN